MKQEFQARIIDFKPKDVLIDLDLGSHRCTRLLKDDLVQKLYDSFLLERNMSFILEIDGTEQNVKPIPGFDPIFASMHEVFIRTRFDLSEKERIYQLRMHELKTKMDELQEEMNQIALEYKRECLK